MEILGLLVGSNAGLAALASVSLAITVLTVSLGALAYKAKQGSDSGR